jgi:hypothetical protein
LAGYLGFIASYLTVVAGGSDSSGYFNSARLFATGRFQETPRAPAEFGDMATLNPLHFQPLGFAASTTGGLLVPTYSTGLPLHLALAAKLLGWHTGAVALLLFSAAAAVGLCYAVARELGLGAPLALAGAGCLAAFPVFIFTSLQPLSDTLATTWTLAACWTALRAKANSGWAVAAGAAFAVAVLIRPTNLVFAPTLALFLGANGKRLALFCAGGIPGAVWLAFYNHTLYGSPFRSGYGNIHDSFALSYGAPTLLHFGKWLALLLPAVLLLLPLAALIQPATRSRPLTALLLGFGLITGLYAFYEVSHEVWWCLRFILPGVPLLIIAALLGVEAIGRRFTGPTLRRFRAAAALTIGCWALASSWYWTPRLSVLLMKGYERTYADGARLAREKLPPNAVVLAHAFSGALYYYTDLLLLRWDQIEAPGFARYAALAQHAGRPICAVVFESEETDARRRCPGKWTRVATIANAGLWQIDGTAPP